MYELSGKGSDHWCFVEHVQVTETCIFTGNVGSFRKDRLKVFRTLILYQNLFYQNSHIFDHRSTMRYYIRMRTQIYRRMISNK